MKRAIWTVTFLAGALSLCADVICQWNFNSQMPDADSATGVISPSTGSGIAALIGGTTAGFASGGTPDPVGGDDSAWNTSKYPGTLYSNRTAGVRFLASTVGFEDIKLSWAQQNTSTASRHMRLQYTLDGIDFTDFVVITVSKDGSFTNFNFDLGSLSGVTNNPYFGFQLVTEFDSTAVGGLPGYLGTGAEYNSSSGAIKFDMVTISGRTIGDNNTPPYVFAQFGDQVLPAAGSSPALPFTVLDAEEAATNLTVLKSTSTPAVIPLSNILLGGGGAARTVTVQANGVAGTSRVGLTVVDTGGKSNAFVFDVTVLPANSAPGISGLSFMHTVTGAAAGPTPFTVYDSETPEAGLSVDATAANSLLVPQAGLALSGSGSNRALSIMPAAGRSGVTAVKVSVSDGENITSSMFPLMVLPSNNLIFYEPFDYPHGPTTTNSGFLWNYRSGTRGDCQTTNSMLRLSESSSEDIGAQIIGAPYEPGTGAVLFASFKLRVSGLPSVVPDCFAHFLISQTRVGMISVGTTNAFFGSYRVHVSNGPNDPPVSFPMSMETNVVYLVVMKFEVDAARTTLWVNPTSEQFPSVTATDIQTPGKISTFAFRQSGGIGPELLIDDLRIGMSFAAVTGALGQPWLAGTVQNGKLRLTWENPLHKLQRGGEASGPFTNVTGALTPYETSFNGQRAFFRLKVD